MIDMIFSSAIAQETAKQAAHQPSPLMSFAPLIIIFAIFYFMMIRPQKKRMQQEQSMINAIGKGDEIYTKSGLLGTVTGLTDKVVTLEVTDGVKLKVLKSHVGGLAAKLFEKAQDHKDKK